MYNIIYISTAHQLIDEYELTELLEISRENNKRVNVTGMLLYAEGVFLQVLEGHKDDVVLIYSRIVADTRHSNIIELVRGPLEARNFSEWNMGFASVNADVLKEFEGYVDPAQKNFLESNAQNAAIILLKSFVTTNNMN